MMVVIEKFVTMRTKIIFLFDNHYAIRACCCQHKNRSKTNESVFVPQIDDIITKFDTENKKKLTKSASLRCCTMLDCMRNEKQTTLYVPEMFS